MCGECGCGCELEEYEYRRRFLTNEEKIERLENYSEELEKELDAVQERIKELKS